MRNSGFAGMAAAFAATVAWRLAPLWFTAAAPIPADLTGPEAGRTAPAEITPFPPATPPPEIPNKNPTTKNPQTKFFFIIELQPPHR
ncbi:MAG: hypothetical protein A2X28_03470 [Elusimicrobia bacterium GWA2_56_46]|nr:MAG: hypothetical protein A2X28_03470 [Elusimicrobia bacterium GWA2_56_46]OGR54230.1 MAG: hypothetical protein A2X39_09115 [Elusimicrobia bacterium GWC2_56_31]HBW21808.1 hypothetical protein [Elusimicrobiota bacterium]